MCAPVLDQPIVFAASVTSVPDGQNSVIESCLTAEPTVVDAGPGIETSAVSVLEIHTSGASVNEYIYIVCFRKLTEGRRFVIESCLTAEPSVVDAGPGINTSGVSVLEIN